MNEQGRMGDGAQRSKNSVVCMCTGKLLQTHAMRNMVLSSCAYSLKTEETEDARKAERNKALGTKNNKHARKSGRNGEKGWPLQGKSLYTSCVDQRHISNVVLKHLVVEGTDEKGMSPLCHTIHGIDHLVSLAINCCVIPSELTVQHIFSCC